MEKRKVKPRPPTHAVLLMGDSRVGKSSIISRVCYNRFPYVYDPGWDHDYKDLTLPNNITHRLELEDFSTFSSPDQPFDLRDRVIQSTDGYILIYDITNFASFESVKDIFHEVKGRGGDKPVVILGNKSDNRREREVDEIVGRKLARELRCRFAEVSAKKGTGLEEVFLALATEINNQKRLEEQLETNAAGCHPFSGSMDLDLGKRVVEGWKKISDALDRLHVKILKFMYGPDKPLRDRPGMRYEVIVHTVPVGRGSGEERISLGSRHSKGSKGSKGKTLKKVQSRKKEGREMTQVNSRDSRERDMRMTGGLEISVAR